MGNCKFSKQESEEGRGRGGRKRERERKRRDQYFSIVHTDRRKPREGSMNRPNTLVL